MNTDRNISLPTYPGWISYAGALIAAGFVAFVWPRPLEGGPAVTLFLIVAGGLGIWLDLIWSCEVYRRAKFPKVVQVRRAVVTVVLLVLLFAGISRVALSPNFSELNGDYVSIVGLVAMAISYLAYQADTWVQSRKGTVSTDGSRVGADVA